MQKFKFPMEYLRVTQGEYGTYSHQGSLAMDFGGKDTGRDRLYAPCDMVVKRARTNANGELYLESTEQVQFADGTVDYARLLCIHDSVFNVKEGQIIKQGQYFYDEGGMGSGNANRYATHVHVEGGKGKWKSVTQSPNAYGKYMIENQSSLYDLFILGQDIVVLDNGGYNWVIESKDVDNNETNSNEINVIDISKHQSNYNASIAKNKGIDNVILRCAYSYVEDTKWQVFYKSAKENNQNVGSYGFANWHYKPISGAELTFDYARNDMLNQVNKWIELCKDKLDFWFAIDQELETNRYMGLSITDNKIILKEAYDLLTNAGLKVCIYCSASWAKQYELGKLNIPLWIAYYYYDPADPDFNGVIDYKTGTSEYMKYMQSLGDNLIGWQFGRIGYGKDYGVDSVNVDKNLFFDINKDTTIIRYYIGYANTNDIKSITNKLESLDIGYSVENGYITTDEMSSVIAIEVKSFCDNLIIPCVEYIEKENNDGYNDLLTENEELKAEIIELNAQLELAKKILEEHMNLLNTYETYYNNVKRLTDNIDL